MRVCIRVLVTRNGKLNELEIDGQNVHGGFGNIVVGEKKREREKKKLCHFAPTRILRGIGGGGGGGGGSESNNKNKV